MLQQFVHSSYSARRVGAKSTGNAIRGGFKGTPGVGCLALQLLPGERDQDALIADVDDGVLIQSVSGLHSGVNAISGDFSAGASGLSISNGQVGGPIREFTIASTLAAHAARRRRGRQRRRLAADARRRASASSIRDVTMSGT